MDLKINRIVHLKITAILQISSLQLLLREMERKKILSNYKLQTARGHEAIKNSQEIVHVQRSEPKKGGPCKADKRRPRKCRAVPHEAHGGEEIRKSREEGKLAKVSWSPHGPDIKTNVHRAHPADLILWLQNKGRERCSVP